MNNIFGWFVYFVVRIESDLEKLLREVEAPE